MKWQFQIKCKSRLKSATIRDPVEESATIDSFFQKNFLDYLLRYEDDFLTISKQGYGSVHVSV